MTDDDRDLHREGYQPQFIRGLGSFTAFAAGFSYLSILTGIFQNYFLGFREAGSNGIWTWPVVFAGQLLVALCFADLAARHPFCGGIYAWSRRSGSHFLGWLTGWIYLASLLVTIAAVALAMQIVLPAVSSTFKIFDEVPLNAAFLGTCLIAISTVLNVIGTRWLARIMNLGVVVELIAAIILIVLLLTKAKRSPLELANVDLSSHNFLELSLIPLLAASVMSAYVMYGFDTAGTLAEETINPRKKAPRAIIQALLAAAVLGFLLLVAAGCSAPDLNDSRLASDEFGLPFLIKEVLGDTIGRLFVLASVFAIFICTLAVHANTSRVMFAMARDQVLPASRWLNKIHPITQVPYRAALFIGIVGCSLLLFNMQFEKIMTALVCVSIVWANLAYVLTNVQGLFQRSTAPGFLGRWRWPIHFLAVVWSSLLIVNIGWPRSQFYGEKWLQLYAAPINTIILIAIGLITYFMLRRSRSAEGSR